MESFSPHWLLTVRLGYQTVGPCVYIVFFFRGTDATLALVECSLPVAVGYNNVDDICITRMVY